MFHTEKVFLLSSSGCVLHICIFHVCKSNIVLGAGVVLSQTCGSHLCVILKPVSLPEFPHHPVSVATSSTKRQAEDIHRFRLHLGLRLCTILIPLHYWVVTSQLLYVKTHTLFIYLVLVEAILCNFYPDPWLQKTKLCTLIYCTKQQF